MYNSYGADLIGDEPDWVRYYQNAISAGKAPYSSCYDASTQSMTIDGCGGAPRQYESHPTKIFVEVNKVTATRDNAQTSGN